MSEATTSAGQHYGDSNSPGQSPGSPLQLSTSLDESQIARLATSARELVQRLPQYQPKAQTAKRKTNKELEVKRANKSARRSGELGKLVFGLTVSVFLVRHEHAGRRPETYRIH